MESKKDIEESKSEDKQNSPTGQAFEKIRGSKRKKEMTLASNNGSTSQSLKLTPKKKKNKKTKANENKKTTSFGFNSSKIFEFNEIAHNKEASILIHDLIKCFTKNSALPKSELNLLHRTLYEKTVRVFLSVLNGCLEKIFNKVLDTELFQELLVKTKIIKKSVSCQTDVSYGSS